MRELVRNRENGRNSGRREPAYELGGRSPALLGLIRTNPVKLELRL